MADKELLTETVVALPIIPTPEMLKVLAFHKWPEDWEAGKQLQRETNGIVYPKTEIEIAVGQYQRLLQLGSIIEVQKDGKS